MIFHYMTYVSINLESCKIINIILNIELFAY